MHRPGLGKQPQAPTEAEWLAGFRSRLDYWQTYKAVLHIKVESSRGNYSGRTVVLAGLPNHLRLEAFTLFGQTSGLLLLNRDGAKLWIPSEKIVYTADKPETLMEHLLGIPIPLETLEYGLIGCIPPNQLAGLRITHRGTQWLGHSAEPSHSRSYTWDLSSQPPGLHEVDVTEGPWKYTIKYDPPVQLNPQSIPKKIQFLSSQWQMGVTVELMQSSPAFGDDVFYPPFPNNLRRVNLEDTT
jgi:outer membrane biogenesis lipoprotein LolB